VSTLKKETRCTPLQSGDDILACTDGEVVKHKDGCVQGDSCGGLANMVAIKAPDGTITQYGHMTRTSVQKGQMVKKGDKIGVVGSTGNSSGLISISMSSLVERMLMAVSTSIARPVSSVPTART
jgi:hypothetical protein